MKKTLFFLVLLEMCAMTLHAQIGGSLGSSFDKGGTLIMPNNNIGHARSVAVQSDGKIITAGEGFNCNNSECNPKFTITRHNIDGTLDPSFGGEGVVFISPSENGMIDYSAYAASLALSADGKILVTGEYAEYDYNLHDYSNHFTTAIRLNLDGSLDKSFGENGIVNIKVSAGYERAQGIAVQADSKVILVGMAFNKALNTSSMTISRLNTDGSLDNSFNGNGKILLDFPNYSEAMNVKVQPDNKIVVCGIAYNGYADAQFAVARLNIDGSYDNGFDSDGKTLFDLGGRSCFASDLDLQPDGKIVIGGYVEVGNDFDYGIARLNVNGSFDNSFNKNGKKLIDFNSSDDVCFSIAVARDGKIFMSGYSNKFNQKSTYNFNVTKLNADGSLATDFEDNGTKVIDFGGQASSYDFALQDADNMVTVGYASHGLTVRRALASFSTSSAIKSSATSLAEGIQATGLQLKSLTNSATNGLSVMVISDNVNEKINLRVIDSEGRLIERQNNVYSGKTYRVDRNIIPGVYYVEAVQARQRKVLKIIRFPE
jgi:uncharacterized delta-60 repeat protein